MRFRFATLAALCALAGPLLAHADQASKAAKIDEMLTLSHADRVLAQMTAQLQPMIESQIQKMSLPEEARPAAREMQQKMMDLVTGKLNWEKLKPVYVKIYEETFTEEEITGAVEFYKTPAGQAILNKMPLLLQKTTSLMQEMMGDMVPEMTRIQREILDKYKKQ